MSNPQAWLTPDDAPDPSRCWRVLIPDGEKFEAAFRGALALLAMSSNWEQFGSLTPEETAQYFLDANFLTYEMRPCMPIGTVLMFARDTPPDGFLVCDGSGYDTGDYEALFDIIGYEFGGSGSTFNVPDLQERFPMGLGGAVAISDTGGLAAVTLTEAELASHDHPINATIIPSNLAGVTPTYGYNLFPTMATNNAGGDQPHENLPPYIALLPVIAYE